MSQTYFTSDTHFNHANIIKYDKRPYKDVKEMDNSLIANINSKVKKQDVLYCLGDWCFGPKNDNDYMDLVAYYRDAIICDNVHLVFGNHDRHYLRREYLTLFSSVTDLNEININGQKIILCHYSMNVWNKCHKGTWHLFGHSHGSLKDNPESKSFDVGINCHNYFPISFPEVAHIMSFKTFKSVDHHES